MILISHPLGATGVRQITTLMHELERRKSSSAQTRPLLGVVSMCIGTGMGAAAVFEVEENDLNKNSSPLRARI